MILPCQAVTDSHDSTSGVSAGERWKCVNADLQSAEPTRKYNVRSFPSLNKQGRGTFQKDTPRD